MSHKWLDDAIEWFNQPSNLRRLSNILIFSSAVISIVGIALTLVSFGASLALTLAGGSVAFVDAGFQVRADKIEKNRETYKKVEVHKVVVGYIPLYDGITGEVEKIINDNSKKIRDKMYILFCEIRHQAITRISTSNTNQSSRKDMLKAVKS